MIRTFTLDYGLFRPAIDTARRQLTPIHQDSLLAATRANNQLPHANLVNEDPEDHTEWLGLYENWLTGQIPSEFGLITSLGELTFPPISYLARSQLKLEK